ncbi:type VII secretion-associated serine protease mycosin [Actinoplanes teichomyceticus]|uniref:Type VII secretion-associated serine protease mycosin n=1 Tax=Actinoplanes teichomyceticus TaxID=1867 RepID=A0A561WB95_ACTTI|nr:type VII secretion-associated serine protease mycosin [Actinoplanes teichomyceticus]TWG21123.1 type VII secretion-associated serine protease mycosin [Actinoplanes teichomyceticus]GIF14944.1 type VII secretion-associated serine protease [Actinoplanes teichomyceticus]
MNRWWTVRRGSAAAGAVALGLVAGAVPAGPVRAASIQDRQWHLDYLRVAQAHRLSTGKGVVVAVVDTGVEARHPDLAGRVLDGTDVLTHGDGRTDRNGHGTGVSGIIAASGGRNGALGIAPDARILPVGAPIGAQGTGGLVPEGIRWAVDHGARVINMSFRDKRTTGDMREAVRYALQHDVVLVAAVGNTDQDTAVVSPANIPGVLAVSAFDRKGRIWSGAVHGPQVAIAAPGVDIVTLARDQGGKVGGYVDVPGGTSAAAPMVAGAAALVRARYPEMKAPDVINRLLATATDAGPAGRDEQYGFGRLDLVGALTAKVPAVTANPLGNPAPEPSAEAAADTGSAADRWLRKVLVAASAVAGAGVLAGLLGAVLVRRSRRAR